ncbi:hypothetical protein [Algoriphagus sp. Y33]|uniref:hypothetical protein n=1 Tax=Algoriphagus sp. Y33 TaxID=2772483 RepID=UPI0017801224|nr:hypothetical protein [Algoriphagus sp. Y33]
MRLKSNPILIILIVLILSCKNQNKENGSSSHQQYEIAEKDNQGIEKDKIIEQLQGKWKEIEYPYRTAEFEESTVKFVEEGTQYNPKFEKFEVAENCQFDNNNIRDLKPNDVILTLPETARCEKLMVSNDTLTLSGFSTNTNEDYTIIYLKAN